MKNERIGNDISIAWTIRSGGEPYALEGKDITLYLHNPYGKEKVEGYSVNENVISWTFLGKNQKVTGKYSLILVVNEGENGMITTDSCDFVNLVPCSCQAGGEDNDGVQTEVIELTSEISIGVGSYDDTEIREELSRLETDKADKSELTELSLEVSGLSEKIDNLPTAESDVFKAIYGTSTYAEVAEAYAQGKVIHCDYDGYCYVLTSFVGGIAWFVSVVTHTIKMLYLDAKGWNKATYYAENTGNKVTTIDANSTDVKYPSAKAVYDLVQQSGTPSGDPMHYMFEAVGAEYNDTGADITRTGIYGDTIVWKAGYWYLNELGDITTEEMRVIYAERYPTKTMRYMQEWFREASARTTLSALTQVSSTQGNYIGYKAQCETILFTSDINGEIMLANLADGFYRADNLRKILGILNMSSSSAIQATALYSAKLEYVRLKGIKSASNLSGAPLLSNSSILYAIQNEAATSAITITLHADAYDRAMADADIQAALTAHPNVSLAK